MRHGVLNSLKRQFDVLFPAVPAQDRQDFLRGVTFTNLGRERIMAWVVVFTVPVIMALEMKSLLDLGSSHEHLIKWQALAALRLLFVAEALTFLFVARRPESEAKITPAHRYFEFGFVLCSLVITSLQTAIGQPIRSAVLVEFGQLPVPSIGSYLIAVFAFAAFLYLSGRVVALSFGLSWMILVVALFSAQPNVAFSIEDIINVTFMTLLAVVLSQVGYATRAKEFVHLRLIELQRRRLERVVAQLAGSNNKLRRLSYIDPTTRAANRRHFDRYLAREWARAKRERSPLALVMVDIDHFKAFNDEYGHQAGDKCLAEVSACIRTVLKHPGDLLARYGGDEFAAILPDTDLEAAKRVAERIGRAVAGLGIEVSSSSNRLLTVSLGTACWHPTLNEKPQSLVAAADEALYRAKIAGRNCAMCATTG